MALDATVGGATANSFLTVVEADAILTTEWLNATAWTANPSKQAPALIMATTLIAAGFWFEGTKKTIEQSLPFPRSGLLDQDQQQIDYNTIPTLIKKATAVLANHLLTGDRLADPKLLGLGIASASLGPLSVTLDKDQVKDMIPRDVVLLLAPLGYTVAGATEGMSVVKLTRS